jgi:hypothetical protein
MTLYFRCVVGRKHEMRPINLMIFDLDRDLRDLTDALVPLAGREGDSSITHSIVVNNREWNLKESPLMACYHLMDTVLTALEDLAAVLRAPSHETTLVDRRAAYDVAANAASLILTIIHCASKHAPALSQRNVVSSSPIIESSSVQQPTLTSPSSSTLLNCAQEDRQTDLQWKTICAVTVSQLLQYIHPSVVGGIERSMHRDPEITLREAEVGKQLITAARSISRYLGTDLCGILLNDPSPCCSLLRNLCIRQYPRMVSEGALVELCDPLALWASWIPSQLRHCTSGSDTVADSNNAMSWSTLEGGRLAILMLDALRRWCHDWLDRAEQTRDAEASNVSPRDAMRHEDSALLPASAFRALSELSDCITLVLEADDIAQAPKLLSGVVSGLPANVMEGYLSVWSRVVSRTSALEQGEDRPAVEDLPHLASHQRVDRALDLSVDLAASAITHDADTSLLATSAGNVEVVALLPDGRTIAERAAHLALSSVTHGNHDEHRMLTEDEVKRVMTQFATNCEEKLHEMQLRLATLEAHNTNLATRIVSNLVTARALGAITSASCFADLMDLSSTGTDPMLSSPLDTTSRAAAQYLRDTGLASSVKALRVSSTATSPPSESQWADELVAEHFNAALFEKQLCREAETAGESCVNWASACSIIDKCVQLHIHSLSSTSVLSVPLHPSTIKTNRGATLQQDAALDTDDGGGGGHGRSSSALEVLSHDEQLAEQEAEVDRLMKEARIMTPRHRAGSRPPGGTALRTPRETMVITPRPADTSERSVVEDHGNTFVSPISDTSS